MRPNEISNYQLRQILAEWGDPQWYHERYYRRYQDADELWEEHEEEYYGVREIDTEQLALELLLWEDHIAPGGHTKCRCFYCQRAKT